MTAAPQTLTPPAAAEAGEGHLQGRRWDRVFVVGGVWIVPLPILAHMGLRAAGVPVGAAEDIVTLAVMVPLGGPHVVATLARTVFEPRFWRGEPWLAAASVLVLTTVAAAATASAFLDVRLGGAPPMAWLLTFFFFWAGLHVVQQHCQVAAWLGERVPRAARSRWDRIDYAVMLLALYPVSLFRMSMAVPGDPGVANPDALATRIVLALGGSSQFADEYVFRIGRATPMLPQLLLHETWWLLVTAAFVASVVLFAWKTLRAHRAGVRFGTRGRLVVAMGGIGAVVPLVPNLDTAFQGINAWHSFQYLGLSMLLLRTSVANGEIGRPLVRDLARPGRALRAYGLALGATLGLVAAILGAAWFLQVASDGRFVMFGHERPPVDAATGVVLYRPGSVLLAYYLLGFGFLLIHYLQDTVCFLRGRPLAV